MPARPVDEIARLFDESTALSPDDFTRRHGIAPGYMVGSNAYFTCTATIPARWNRLIFYDGSLLHSGDILAPERLSADPSQGRLTLNGFFVSKRKAA